MTQKPIPRPVNRPRPRGPVPSNPGMPVTFPRLAASQRPGPVRLVSHPVRVPPAVSCPLGTELRASVVRGRHLRRTGAPRAGQHRRHHDQQHRQHQHAFHVLLSLRCSSCRVEGRSRPAAGRNNAGAELPTSGAAGWHEESVSGQLLCPTPIFPLPAHPGPRPGACDGVRASARSTSACRSKSTWRSTKAVPSHPSRSRESIRCFSRTAYGSSQPDPSQGYSCDMQRYATHYARKMQWRLAWWHGLSRPWARPRCFCPTNASGAPQGVR